MINEMPTATLSQTVLNPNFLEVMDALKDKSGKLTYIKYLKIIKGVRTLVVQEDGTKPIEVSLPILVNKKSSLKWLYKAYLADVAVNLYVPIIADILLLRDPVNELYLVKPKTSKKIYKYILLKRGKYKGWVLPSFTHRNFSLSTEKCLKAMRMLDISKATERERELLIDISLIQFCRYAWKIQRFRMNHRYHHHRFEFNYTMRWLNRFFRGALKFDDLFVYSKYSKFLNYSDTYSSARFRKIQAHNNH